MKTLSLSKKQTSLILLSVILFTCSSIQVYAQDTSLTKLKLNTIANGILKDATFQFVDQNTGKKYSLPSEATPDAVLVLDSPYNDWRYWNGVLNIGMVNLADAFSNPSFREFVIKNIEFAFNNSNFFRSKNKPEGRWTLPFSQFLTMEELDDCGAMGGSLIEIYKNDKQKQYEEYLNKAANHILKKQARLDDKTLVRTSPHKFTLWADDLYMSISFLSRMGELTGEKKYFDDAVNQVINFHKYLFDKNACLMYHCWYSDLKKTGVAFWGRANGWALLAQVDLLDRLPKDNPKRKNLIELLQKHIVGISRYQSSSGLWHQLLDKVDSYLETSCSAMFTYSIARSVNKGYIDARYKSIAIRGWNGVITKILPDGKIEGICAGTGTSDDLVHYYTRPAPLNDIHGIGAVLLAGTEILKLPK